MCDIFDKCFKIQKIAFDGLKLALKVVGSLSWDGFDVAV